MLLMKALCYSVHYHLAGLYASEYCDCRSDQSELEAAPNLINDLRIGHPLASATRCRDSCDTSLQMLRGKTDFEGRAE